MKYDINTDICVEDFGRASLFCPVLSYRSPDDVTEDGTSGNFRFCVNMDGLLLLS